MPYPVLEELLRGSLAPAPRTLVDIFAGTAARHPDEPALDSGIETLSYAQFHSAAADLAAQVSDLGIGPGDRVGVRLTSGTTELYVAIMGVLMAGAAYVPVDADDPDERARVVFTEATVAAVVGPGLVVVDRRTADPTSGGARSEATPVQVTPADVPQERMAPRPPAPEDDAWVIFTSGSTGTPKGVAVTHRNAAAFVDAEACLFLRAEPIGPGDRVMAGLSVAFDASCEEMWLAWAHGGCLVPAPRSLVRSGIDVGPWLVANQITVVSTVPTLVALWPSEALGRVRLVILGGEACPAELAARLQAPGREVWNTYGPTEATVVACGARVSGKPPVRIGLPLAGWDLAVVDETGHPVGPGAEGELIIGGVGLARYLDPTKDAEKYAAMPTLGWSRAYRSGDIVVNDPEGLLFAGRKDDQVKVGGRRIELGELDGQLLRLPGVASAAAAVRKTATGNTLLVGYVTLDASGAFDPVGAADVLRHRLPAALVPRLAVVPDLPTKTSGKVDRDALPWPLPSTGSGADLDGTQGWVADIWRDVLGADVTSADDDFFGFGGGSLSAAQVVGRTRQRFPEVVVADVYAQHTIRSFAAYLDEMGTGSNTIDRSVPPIPVKTQAGQLLALVGLRGLAATRWMTWLVVAGTVLGDTLTWLPSYPWWVTAAAVTVFVLPPGRMLLAAGLARLVLRGVTQGSYPRGGKVHLRVWLADRVQAELAAGGLAGAVFFTTYARLLGARIGHGVDLHSLPPVTGMLRLGEGASVEPEVDLSGTWVEGDRLHVGAVWIGDRARVGTRSTLGPGAVLGHDAEVAPGSYLDGSVVVPDDAAWSGAPAGPRGAARGPWSPEAPAPRRRWLVGYAVASVLVAALPGLAVVAGGLVLLPALRAATTPWEALAGSLPWLVVATLVSAVVLCLALVATVRVLAIWISPGHYPVRSMPGLAVWSTVRMLDEARTWLFPLYSSSLTPSWLRALGATIGEGVEASTVLMIPSLTQVNDQAFLADDTLIGGYELGGGWIRVERVKIGKRAFVGNSGMAAPGRKVPKASLVAVLSAAPSRRTSKPKPGSSWLGSPPAPLRRTAGEAEAGRTYDPPTRLKVARSLIELARLLPVVLAGALALTVLAALATALEAGWWVALLVAGPVMLLAGLLAGAVTAAAKWALVGRHTVGEHPLWSSFVWRNELADTFVEVLAAPWLASPAQGTPLLTQWLRLMGAHIGRGVWCDTYWLPETDLVTLGAGATVNHGCVVQTHLFHDRVLAMDTVVLKAGASLGPHSVVLPAAEIGAHAGVGPMSLVMRGEAVPGRTRWIGNPIGPWEKVEP